MSAQGLREQIAANSTAWISTRDKKQRDALHQKNVELYSQLDALTGSTSTYDGRTGTWTTSQPGAGDYAATPLPQVSDLSGQAAKLQRETTQKSIASLERAKGRADAALSAQEAAIGGIYQSARNQAAAQGEIGRKVLGEQAAQSGLNTGAAGQLALAQNVAQQGALSAIDAQETQARRENAQARQTMESDYAYAVAEAQAEGDYALAQALYDEAVRYDKAQLERAKAQEEQSRDVYALARQNRQLEDQRADEAREWAWQAQERALSAQQRQEDADLKSALSRASFGDFQGYLRLGYTQGEVDRMTRLWRYYQFVK